MKCPKCKSEMEIGFIQAGQMMIWTPRKHKISLNPRADGRDIVLDKNYLTTASIEAHCCRDCGFILIPIPAKEGNRDD